jgi:hypothetical protein
MGGHYDPQRTPRCIKRPVKNIGKSKTTGESASGETPAALKPIRDCKAKGWRWDQASAKCIKPSEAKADCEARGHQYDMDTGRCIKSIKPNQAEEQSSSEQTSDESDDDYEPKKKKRKRHYDD